MKKKIRDLTDKEIKDICNKYNYFDCFSCPLITCPTHAHYLYYKNENLEEMEVEVE